jgi:hypothetical protein
MSTMNLSVTASGTHRAPNWNDLKHCLIEWQQRAHFHRGLARRYGSSVAFYCNNGARYWRRPAPSARRCAQEWPGNCNRPALQ